MTQESDYIDEYGINHGPGVEIGGVVWAPVNCGYHETDFKYGKLYQWGRKYGQGYNGILYDFKCNASGTYSDAYSPEIVKGPVSLSAGESKNNENNFYYDWSSSPYDWCNVPDDNLWNSGTEDKPIKTEYDPCPAGWRVPIASELDELCQNRSVRTIEGEQIGYWFSGANLYNQSVPRVFFPAAGGLTYVDGVARGRGYSGSYWSSSNNCNFTTYYLSFWDTSNVEVDDSNIRASGDSVRCVQVTD